MNPAFWSFDTAHLDSCQCIIKFLCNRSHLIHTTWETDFFTMVNNLVSTFAVRVPVVFFVSRIAGATLLHIGIGAPAASAVQIVIQLIYYRSGRWRDSDIGPVHNT